MDNSTGTTLGIDIGGSKSLVALVEGRNVVESRVVPTAPDAGPEGWIAAASEAASPWRGRYDRVAAAVTGHVSGDRWQALNPRTLAMSSRFALHDHMRDVFGRPVHAVNDAQAAAWGEYRFGAGADRDMVFLTVSTGLGGGMVLNGSLRPGARGLAGHFGLVPADLLAADQPDQFENQATGHWIVAQARRMGHDVDDARQVFAAADGGQDWAGSIIDTSAMRVARLCAAIQLTIDPDVIVVGGGVGLAPGYADRLRGHLATMADQFRPHLKTAVLGRHAGVIGAADLAVSIHPNTPNRQETS